MARIIYVEDDPLVGEVVQSILTEAGHLVGVIAHGTLAFDTIAFKKPDLVILDRGLPGMTGVEILEAIRRLPGLYLTPILMLSAKGSEEAIAEAMESGANDYLVKPFEPEELVRRVGQVLRANNWKREEKATAAAEVVETAEAPETPAAPPSSVEHGGGDLTPELAQLVSLFRQ
ncbi:response regulator transcription factor [Sphingomonas sp.]|uniref:response regulator transcription factor n=1 Tax=Sphingomonas sp. TaxID=28214 RepID=UPI001B2C3BBE|nr:response regulator transcription factor [Sphingomonas sp.]MBO9714276.1 response regulator transcription factor [Sphingomonas sp.]